MSEMDGRASRPKSSDAVSGKRRRPRPLHPALDAFLQELGALAGEAVLENWLEKKDFPAASISSPGGMDRSRTPAEIEATEIDGDCREANFSSQRQKKSQRRQPIMGE